MKLKTFSLAVDESGALDDSEMTSELEGCDVLKVWERFLEEERVWLVMVGYRVNATREARGDEARGKKISEGRRTRQRLLETLDPLEQKVFEALRAWRVVTATVKQVGPHFILTNAQLVEALKRNPKTLDELREVKGIGQGKADEFGESLLKALADSWETQAQDIEDAK